jgi:ketosteroid isomerase-like protein
MSKQLLDAYVATWPKHVNAGDSPEGQANLGEFLSLLADDVVYEDVPSGHTFAGHEGIRQMCSFVSNSFDVDLAVVAAQTDGERFAIEFETTMTIVDTGAVVANQGVAVGTIVDGKIATHRDFHVTPGAAEGS